MLAALLLPLGLAAQQRTTAALTLPDAPSFQLDAQSSSNPPAPPAATTGQQTSSPASPQTQTPGQRHAQSEKELSAEEKQRMLGVIPNFNTVMSGEAAPIDAHQKFVLFFKSSVDPFQFVAAGLDAGIEQWQDSYPEYHFGLAGYARRYGASFTDGFDGNFWGNAVLPSVLHQDPRYFRLGHGSFKTRLGYSLISTVRCKGDNGQWQPNYSNVIGNFIGGAISNAYYPASDRGFGLTIERGFSITAEGAIGSLAVEFYPDIIQHLRNHHKKHTTPAP